STLPSSSGTGRPLPTTATATGEQYSVAAILRLLASTVSTPTGGAATDPAGPTGRYRLALPVDPERGCNPSWMRNAQPRRPRRRPPPATDRRGVPGSHGGCPRSRWRPP